MINIYKKYLLLLPIYVLIQILILNQILFFSYINPFLYIILIINLPLKTSKLFLFIYSFLLGLAVDFFSTSIGFHSTACVLIAFIKPFISKITIPHNMLAEEDEISLKKIGNQSLIIFLLIIIFIHHSCLFYLEHLTINMQIIIKIIFSTLISAVIIFITQILLQIKK